MWPHALPEQEVAIPLPGGTDKASGRQETQLLAGVVYTQVSPWTVGQRVLPGHSQ